MPLIETDMPAAEYHRSPAVSKSLLDQFAKSPLHAKAYLAGIRELETPAMAFGTAYHAAMLEPDRFKKEFATFEGDRRTKEGKAAYQALLDAGKTIISRSDADVLSAMVDVFLDHPVVKMLHANGMEEASVFWTDPVTNVPCRCRPDYWHADGKGLILDFKTTEDASPEGFARSVAKYRYHVQAAHYMAGTHAQRFVFIAQEKKAPFAIGVYELDEQSLELGREIRDRELAEYAVCLATDYWPGYSQEIVPLTLPGWAFPKIETEEVEVNYV